MALNVWVMLGQGPKRDCYNPMLCKDLMVTKQVLACAQVPAWMGGKKNENLALAGCILCFASLLIYCTYHVSGGILGLLKKGGLIRGCYLGRRGRGLDPYASCLA
jgi:hypothetical protein